MKKIALVGDVKGWAFDITSHIIKNQLEEKIEVDIYYSIDFNGNLFRMLEKLKNYDIIHFFWRKLLIQFENDEFIQKVNEKYGKFEEYKNMMVAKISTGVYDHLFENELELNKKIFKYCNKYVVSSKKLFDVYSNIKEIKAPTCIMGDTFEKDLFFPINIERFEKENLNDRELVIGWVGNSVWNQKEKDKDGNVIDFKGLHTILKPVVDELRKENYKITLKYADKNIEVIPNDRMRNFYKDIDIYICVSTREGTPKPLLEAMGCAVPIITTDVGVSREVLGEKQQEYILGIRNVNENDADIRNRLKEKLIKIYNNREILRELSKENYEMSKAVESQEIGKIYYEYFNNF